MNCFQLELKEWLAMEIDVTSDRDILQWSERGAYLHWVIQNDYAGDGQHSDVTQVFPAIVEAVVRHALSRPLSAPGCSQDLLMLLQSQVTSSLLCNTSA